jgi:signal peptidase
MQKPFPGICRSEKVCIIGGGYRIAENMSGQKGQDQSGSLIDRFRTSSNPAVAFARDILWVVAVVGTIALVLFLVSGTWPAVVAVESESMVPNMQVGDLVLVVAPDRFGELQTWEEGEETGYARFAEYPDLQGQTPYGDVIVYRPNGADSVHPIIHRAIRWEEGEPHAGYITKGDNNPIEDQRFSISGIGAIEPVKEEWVVGKALFAIPLLGYLPLNIVPFALLIIVLMIIHELYLRKREKDETRTAAQKKKKH